MADQVRVFVSHHHSTGEDAFTARLVADLEAAGADVWVDDARITADDFIKKINEGLTGRQWLVLVMTPDSLRSPWVQAEVNAALLQVRQGRMLGVIPLVAQPCNDADIPPLWATLHRYDTISDYQGAVSGLLKALGLADRVMGEMQPAPPTPTEAPSPTVVQPSIPPEHFPRLLASLGYEEHVINGVEIILPPRCDIPAGEFLMGSDRKKDKEVMSNETSQQKWKLPDFQIARFPVTVAEYACYVRATHAEPQSWKKWDKVVDWKTQLRHLDHPVVIVSWFDALFYAQWLAEVTGEPWRLPSEEEWEKAARGTDGRIYPWGDSFDRTHANTSEVTRYKGGIGTTTPVGSYPSGESPYGAQDMTGNVWEWTSSENKVYPILPAEGVLRGGSWQSLPEEARAACRLLPAASDSLTLVSDDIGFRLARSVPNS